MSLILEALRKSEAERRRAQAPDLFAPAQVAVAPVRRLPPAWVLVGGALLVVVAALLLARGFWRATGDREPAVVPEPADATASMPRPAATPVPANTGTPVDAEPRLLPTPVPPPAAMVDANTPAPAPQPGDASAPNTTGADDALVEAAPLPAPQPAASVPAAAVAEPVPAPAGGDTAPPMRLSELAADARRQLPPLKMTMHMWNEAADRRFVILDGRRVAEGDRIGAARVAEIRRDGVILEWNGQRLELPLR